MSDEETCTVCGKEVKTQIQKGTGLCGDNCRKIHEGEVERPKPQMDAGITNQLNNNHSVNLRGIV